MRLTVTESNLQLQLPVDNVISNFEARVFDTMRIVRTQFTVLPREAILKHGVGDYDSTRSVFNYGTLWCNGSP